MRKAMGSLLLCIYLSSASQHCNDNLELLTLNEIVKNKNIISVLRKRDYEPEYDLNMQINSLIGKVDHNMFRLKSLINLQKNLFEKVKVAMGLKAKTKEALTQEQMESYRSYIQTYFDNKENIESNVNQINVYDELSEAKVELFKNKTNYKMVYNIIVKINSFHEKILSLLNDNIYQGNQTLAVLA